MFRVRTVRSVGRRTRHNSMKQRFKLHQMALLAVLSSGAAHAGLVWDNGGPAAVNQGGSNMSDTLQAEDFQLLSTTNLTGITFWNLQGVGGDYNGSIFWKIVGNTSGQPNDGAVFGSGSATPTRTPQGTVVGFSLFQNDFSIALNGVLPGTYWLELHNGPLATTNFTDFYWSLADSNATNSGTNPGQARGLNPVPGWSTNDNEHAVNMSA